MVGDERGGGPAPPGELAADERMEVAADERMEVAVAAHELWALRADFTRLPEYNPDVSDVRRTDDDRYEFTLATPAGPHPVALCITEREPDRLVAASMHGGMTAHERFEVEELGARRSAARLTLWLEVPEGLREELRREVLDSSRRQIRLELDLMREVLERVG